MIDSHCHLDHEPLFSNIGDVINRAKKVGLKKQSLEFLGKIKRKK